MPKFTNEFSWSKSRMDIFNECTRKYYLHYYGSWGGWENNAPDDVRRLYVLKQLKNRWMWAGEVVHDCLQRTLDDLHRGIKPLPPEQILELTRKLMRSDFRSSREGLYRHNPKSCALFEHEYQLPVSREQWKALAEQVQLALSNFFHSSTCKTILSLPPQQIEEIEQFSSFELEGFKINVKLDFCYSQGGQIYIYDWKTGKASQGSELQLVCYALYAQSRWQVDFTKCKLIEYNLAVDKLSQFFISLRILEDVRNRILESARQMQQLLADKRHNIAREEDFAKTEQPNACKYCNFLRVCRPELMTQIYPTGAKQNAG